MKSLSFKHMLSYNVRVTRRLVPGDREEEMGEQGEKPILKATAKTVVGDRSLLLGSLGTWDSPTPNSVPRNDSSFTH